MKALIIYGCDKKLTNAHKQVVHLCGRSTEYQYFVRVELFDGDYPEALDKAEPMPGEVVLNTVPFPVSTPADPLAPLKAQVDTLEGGQK